MVDASQRVFKKLRLGQWRQFASIDIDFHSKLTVITGANGAGKSTLLNIVARHLGVERPYLSVPQQGADGTLRYITGLFKSSSSWLSLLSWWPKVTNQVGEIQYSDDATASLSVPDSVGHQYSLEVGNQREIQGIAISSHRSIPTYYQIPHISFRGIDPDAAFNLFMDEANNRYRGTYYGPENSLMFRIKNTIAAWAAIGEGNSVLQANVRQRNAYLGFVSVLRKVLPESLGFIDLAVRPPEVVMVTKSGEFLIDAVSGGVSTLIENAALIYACSIRSDVVGKNFVVSFDEPENHLHPELQRDLFSKLTAAFPQVQFIVATHSPFIVSSLKDSNVYVLRYREADAGAVETESRRVISQKLDYVNRSGTASEILRDVLGVPSTIPRWAEADLKGILERYQEMEISDESLSNLKRDLEVAGLVDLFPEALTEIARVR